MRMKIIVCIGLFIIFVLNSRANLASELTRDEYVTQPSAILCLSPFKFEEAYKAVGDKNWMKEIGCIVAKSGLRVTKIAELEVAGYPLWQVRVYSSDGGGVTVWGSSVSFR